MEKPQPFGKAGRTLTPQRMGRVKERELARDLGGKQQPGSGCFDGRGGDVVVNEYLVEHKYTRALSYTVSIQTLRKITQEAFEQRKKPVLVIEMSGQMMYQEEKWACIPYEEFKRLLEERV